MSIEIFYWASPLSIITSFKENLVVMESLFGWRNTHFSQETRSPNVCGLFALLREVIVIAM